MKPKTLVLMVIAVGCGLVASFMTSRYLAAGQNQVVVQEEKVTVLVPKQKLSQFTLLNDVELFEEKQFDKRSVSKDVISDFEKIKGRRMKNALEAGKPLAESDLVDPDKFNLEHKLNPGEVALTIKVSPEESVGGFILPGCRVDVIATMTRTTERGERPFSKVILQNVEVLATNAQLTAPENINNQQIDRVTLRVTRKQSEQVTVFAETGKLRLILRRPDDSKIEETSGSDSKGPRYNGVDESGAPTGEAGVVNPSIQGPTVPGDVRPEVTADEAKKNTKLNVYGATSKPKEFEFQDGTDPKEKKDAPKPPTEKK